MTAFQRLHERRVYANPHVAIDVHDVVHPAGHEAEHVLVVTPQASAVLLADADDLLFCRQPRFAVESEVVEIVKGGADPGESALECAQRETREELGIEAAHWEDLGQLLEVPSIMMQPVRLFYAHGIEHVEKDEDGTERIELVRLPQTVAFRAAASGQINDAITIAALLRFGMRRGLLRV